MPLLKLPKEMYISNTVLILGDNAALDVHAENTIIQCSSSTELSKFILNN